MNRIFRNTTQKFIISLIFNNIRHNRLLKFGILAMNKTDLNYVFI